MLKTVFCFVTISHQKCDTSCPRAQGRTDSYLLSCPLLFLFHLPHDCCWARILSQTTEPSRIKRTQHKNMSAIARTLETQLFPLSHPIEYLAVRYKGSSHLDSDEDRIQEVAVLKTVFRFVAISHQKCDTSCQCTGGRTDSYLLS